jgi:hypothetical protein
MRAKEREAALREEITTDGQARDEYLAATVRNPNGGYDALFAQPAKSLFLTPQNRVRGC